MSHLTHALTQFGTNTARLLAYSLAIFPLIWFCEWRLGSRMERYRSRNFQHDLFYWFYYLTGFHNALFLGILYGALSLPLGFLRLHALDRLPSVARYLIFLVAADFVTYWFHRWKHSNPFLWAFHSMHHSQEVLTAPTLTRGHPVESILGAVVLFFPLQVLGAPPGLWLPLALLRQFLEASQHSELPWTFGPFYRIIVSPKFHAFHHSAKPEHHNRNFGMNLSLWDFLFGTSITEESRPSVYGLPELRMPTLRSQFVTPIRLAWQACFSQR